MRELLLRRLGCPDWWHARVIKLPQNETGHLQLVFRETIGSKRCVPSSALQYPTDANLYYPQEHTHR